MYRYFTDATKYFWMSLFSFFVSSIFNKYQCKTGSDKRQKKGNIQCFELSMTGAGGGEDLASFFWNCNFG